MSGTDVFYNRRTELTTEFLRNVFVDLVSFSGLYSEEVARACTQVGEIALGGKHMRSLLVHIGADREGDPPQSDITIAAAFDMLHASFLVLDDVIDQDELRRGKPTVHAEARRRAMVEFSDEDGEHYGASVAILAGTSALNEAYRLVVSSDAPAEVRLEVLNMLGKAISDSMIGEFMDVHHSLVGVSPSPEQVRTSSRLKTSAYTFEAPLATGALLAGHGEKIDALVAIGRHLGAAFQIGDDMQSVYAEASVSGKAVAGDLLNHRRTPLITYAQDTPEWPRIQSAIQLRDIAQVRQLLQDCGAVAKAVDEAETHLNAASEEITDELFSAAAGGCLRLIIDDIEASLHV